jgi:hypothetical protein
MYPVKTKTATRKISGFFIYLKSTGLPPLIIKSRDAYTYLEYHFLDNEGTEIIVK